MSIAKMYFHPHFYMLFQLRQSLAAIAVMKITGPSTNSGVYFLYNQGKRQCRPLPAGQFRDPVLD
jgi:hypothetical protein